jgi:phosphoglycerol transferase MdoB-like AlkP superfamily enzyme
MKWEISPFTLPLISANNKSSRSIDKTLPPDNGELDLSVSLLFGSTVLGVERHVWSIFTNTGTKQLRDIELVLPRSFNYYGTVPDTLDVGDKFIIRLTYDSAKLGPITGNVYVKAHKVVFDFPFSANVTLGNFTYNDAAMYDGIQTYDGELNV